MPWNRSKRARPPESGEWSGFLDKSVRLQGTLEFPGTFRMEGEVKGTIISSHTLMLGEGARVEGQIEGNHVMISGRFDGVAFLPRGESKYSLKELSPVRFATPCLVIEAGGIFDGQCHMLAASETAKPLTISDSSCPSRVDQRFRARPSKPLIQQRRECATGGADGYRHARHRPGALIGKAFFDDSPGAKTAFLARKTSHTRARGDHFGDAGRNLPGH